MINNFLKRFKKEFKTLNLISVSKDNLLNNYNYLSSLSKNITIAPVIKSNGYGHGILNVAKILEKENPPFFCVDSLYEAYQLRKAKIKIPILITGYTNPQNLKVKKLRFNYAVYTQDLLEAIAKYQPQAGVHIFVDTGMRREGVILDDLPKFLEKAKKLSLKIDGLMSHLSSSKGRNDKLFLNQINNFKKAKEIFKKYKINPKWIHISASGSLINPEARKIISSISNLSRAGIALYGLENDPHLKPALKLMTHIAQVKLLKKGEKVGYDGTFNAKEDLKIANLPIGYYDGVDRALSNKGFVKIDNIDCPIVGRVSMNLTTIDISKLKNPYIGQEVLVYSDNPKDKNSIENVAKICKKIPYEILVNLAESTRKVII